jgi:hypothetical protein
MGDMLIETVCRTEDLPAADRFEYWRELISRTYAPMDLSSDGTDGFRAHQRLIRLGALSVWPAEFQPLVYRRTPKLVRQSDPEVYHLTLVLQGSGGASWDKQEAAYRTHDFHANGRFPLIVDTLIIGS